jgi:hypothetical protein
LSHIAALRIAPEPAFSLLFYSDRDPALGKAVSILNADGSERARWPVAAGRTVVSSVAADGTASVLAVDKDTLVEHAALTGAVLSRTPVHASSAFRSFFAGRLRENFRVLVFSGGGYVNRHMIVVISPTGSVVYQEAGDGRAYAFSVASPGAQGFYVAVEGHVTRYELPNGQ